MHFLTDFDNQTKLLHVGYSVLGMLVSMVVLVKFKPALMPRMIVAVILGFVLVYCLTTTGDLERVKNITSIGWFVLGLLFGIGRGEFVIEYLACRFFGAGDAAAAPATAEAAGDAGEDAAEEKRPDRQENLQPIKEGSQSEVQGSSSSSESLSIKVNEPEELPASDKS